MKLKVGSLSMADDGLLSKRRRKLFSEENEAKFPGIVNVAFKTFWLIGGYLKMIVCKAVKLHLCALNFVPMQD